jgi:hypothetical protein
MTYAFTDGIIGYPPIESGPVAVPAALSALPVLPGLLVQAIDQVYGSGEFIFARASAGIRQFGLCTFLPVWNSTTLTYTYNATEVANTANLAQTLAVSQIVLTTGQYGWFQVQASPLLKNSSTSCDFGSWWARAIPRSSPSPAAPSITTRWACPRPMGRGRWPTCPSAPALARLRR